MRTVKTIVLFFLFVLVCQENNAQTIWADSCVRTSFYGKISSRFSSFERVHAYPGGDIIAVGEIQAFDSLHNKVKVYGLVLRLTPYGNIVWSRFVGFVNSSQNSDTRIYASTLCSNGDIVACTHNSMAPEPGGNIIVRFSGDGNLLWARRVNDLNYNYIVEDIMETSDGGVLMCGPSSFVGVVTKLDAFGNFKWTAGFSNYNYVNCRAVAESPSGYYATGYSYDFSGDSSRNLLMKMDKQSGDTIWVKSFGDASQGQGQCEFGFDKMTFRNGLLDLVGSTSVNYSGPNRSAQAVISFNENGQIVSAMRMENSSAPMNPASLFRGSLYDPYAKTGVQYLFSDTSDFYVFKLNNDNSAQWAWRLPMTGMELAEASTIGTDTSLIVAGFNWTSDGENGALVKVNADGKLQNCSNVPVSITTTPFSITARPRALPSTKYNADSTRVTSLTAISGYGFSFNHLCADSNSCHLSKIHGPAVVCQGRSYVYKVTRKGACMGPVRFLAPGNAIASVVSDTSVLLSFSQAGTYKLIANIDAACKTLQDSMLITVSFGAAGFTLGPDTTLCKGSQIKLEANDDAFVNYLWQDGSTASSFVVTASGLYHVVVADACDNTFKDSVLITEASSIPINIGPDRIKCNNDTVHLSAPPGFLNYQWSNNYNISSTTSQSVIINPLTDTVYYVKAEKTPGCFAYDTVRVHVNASPPINLGSDKSFCSGDSAVFDVGSDFNTYLWSNGSTQPAIIVKNAGTYSVVGVDNQGCKTYDTAKVVNVFANPIVKLDHNPSLCTGGTRPLDAGNFSSYLWNNGSTFRKISVDDIGIYAVVVTDNNGCKGTDTTVITTLLSLPSGFLPADTLLCSYDKLILVSKQLYSAYQWSSGASGSSITVSEPGTYWLQVKHANGCAGRDSIIINMKDCMKGFYIPTAFTPNKDGKNDAFRPRLFGNVKKYRFVVYNRWGQIVFQTTELNKAWDGTVAGVMQDSNVFTWICDYQFENEEVKTQKGTVMLIR